MCTPEKIRQANVHKVSKLCRTRNKNLVLAPTGAQAASRLSIWLIGSCVVTKASEALVGNLEADFDVGQFFCPPVNSTSMASTMNIFCLIGELTRQMYITLSINVYF
jgi:hypothetical protein